MKRTVIDTEDNSKTLLINNTDITYHSRHGALTESNHIFIKHGLNSLRSSQEIKVFEMGFGTGLNVILSYDFATINNINIDYHSIEKFPLTNHEVKSFDITTFLKKSLHSIFQKIHEAQWDKTCNLNANFKLKKIKNDIKIIEIESNQYDIIFFDAFGPKFQPELWQLPVLKKMHDSLKQDGTIITYCAQGQFKRNLKIAGFKVENLPGPPGKREITRGIK
ncbi:MAG: tRNA (5-methylaminomethyl-2-thiouridine)(34)-methyltransferase MnmD [Crocinitomicaceae bacterium]